MAVRAGEIHALLGANGAGKSTLCKIISGLVSATDGTMQLAGRPFMPANKQEAEAAGVEIVQQELNLVPTLSVAENLFLSRLPNRGGILRSRQLHEDARRVLNRFGLSEVSTHTAVGSLGVGRQQMVEIATALARQCKLLILDEPTAALTGGESKQLFEHLRRLRDSGVGIIYISHRLDEVATLSDRVTVLRDGKWIATEDSSSQTTDELVALMSGDEKAMLAETHTSHRRSDVAMQVRSLHCGIVEDVSFIVRRGERLGITGLVGSGRTELLRAVFGADVATAGDVVVGKSNVGRRFRHPAEAVAAGLAMVTEDRKHNGLLLSQSILVNTTLSSLRKRFSRHGLIQRTAEVRVTEKLRGQLETRCENIDQTVRTLSGGNQQKVAMAKWLVRDADVFLFDEPTRGIDIATRRTVYRLLDTLSAEGKACVIVSSDLDELVETCDSIGVMCNGKLVETFRRSEWSREKIMRAMFAEFVS